VLTVELVEGRIGYSSEVGFDSSDGGTNVPEREL